MTGIDLRFSRAMASCRGAFRVAMIISMSMYGAVELGGTKTLVAVGTADGEVLSMERIETGDDPFVVSDFVVTYLSGRGVAAVGIAAFGPLQLRDDRPEYGTILATPKAGWQGHNLVESIGVPLGVPVRIDTDVNGAALAEALWGAARGLEHHAYVTVGTGIGAGIVVDRQIVHGISHPEFGHIPVVRHPSDVFPGACPYHGDCLEGMAAGPAVLGRYGLPLNELDDGDRKAAVELVASYVAQGVRTLIYVVSPERVVIGGGVSRAGGFHVEVRRSLMDQMSEYGVFPAHRSDEFVTPPGLGDRSGLIGGLALARQVDW